MTDPNTPSSPGRSRIVRRLAGVAGVLTAIGVLAAPALTPEPSSAGPLGFPYVNEFSSAEGGALHGDAAIVDGRLRLTEDRRNQAGAWSTNDTFPSDLGLEVEFTYAMYTERDDPGADGLVLFLADGAAAQGVGSFDAGLGYTCRKEETQGGAPECDLPGVPGGFAGIGLDHYGNFSARINGSGPGAQADHVVVRGSGDGTTGYRYVAGVRAPGGTGVQTNGATPRRVRVTLLPGDDGELAVTVKLEAGGAMRTVLDAVPLHGDGQVPLPSTLRLGFGAATGSHVDVHEVDALRVWTPADLAVRHTSVPTVDADGTVHYAVEARNVGPNAADPSRLTVDVPEAVEDVTWTCSASDGSTCAQATGAGDVDTDVGLVRGGTATVEVTGRLRDGATGALESTATITPPPSLADTDESDNTDSATGTADRAVAQVETDKSVSPATGVSPGDELEYTVTARNRGPAAAQDVGAVDDLPAALRFAGSPDDCTADGQRVTCRSGAALAPGGTTSFRIRAVLDPAYTGDGSDVVNVATATSPTDPDGGDESDEVGIGVVLPGGPAPTDAPAPTEAPAPTDAPAPTGAPHGPGSPGAGDDGTAGVPDDAGSGDGGRAGARGSGPAALAWTGVEDLPVVAALAAVVLLAGAAGVWAARRQRRRTADADAATGALRPGSDDHL